MTYRPRRADPVAHLRSMRALEEAMQDADLNGSQLARACGASSSYISLIRSGQAQNVSEEYAVAIERTLGLQRGTLFVYGSLDLLADEELAGELQ